MSLDNISTETRKPQFKHLSLEERREIQIHLENGISLRGIAKMLGRSVSTISDEVKRGSIHQRLSNGKEIFKYFADAGQRVYKTNRSKCHAKGIEKYSKKFLDELSVELTAETRTHSVDSFTQTYQAELGEKIPSVKTIYRLIDSESLKVKNIDLPQKLKRQSKNDTPSRPKGTNTKILGTSIDKRPEHVLERIEVGHWEGDLVKGSKEKNEPALLTLVERATRFGIILKVSNFEAETCHQAVKELLEEYGLSMFKSITWDNGSEFSLMGKLEKLNTNLHDLKIYYAHAYSSWERGTNENFNGLLREFVPKGTSIHHFTENDILRFEDALNRRPRKILGYKTAEEAFDAAA